MLPAENTAARPTPTTLPGATPTSTPLPTQFGRPDVRAIGSEVTTLAASDPAAAQLRYTQAQASLNPVEIGELARAVGRTSVASPILHAGWDIPIPDLPDLPSLPGLPSLPDLPSIPGLPGIDLPDLPNPLDVIKEGIGKIGDAIDKLQDAAEAVKDKLASLPHAVADKIADAMRGPDARVLTDDEKAFVKEAFGDRVDLDKVRFVDGPGNSPIARAAFAKGNPAITIGNTVYFKPGHYSTDFAKTAEGQNTLVHELAHVMQYDEMGYAAFGAKYAADLARVGGNPDELYRYDKRETTYATETLEGQAQMVGDYAEIRNSKDPALQGRIADLEKRLEGTGIYGL